MGLPPPPSRLAGIPGGFVRTLGVLEMNILLFLLTSFLVAHLVLERAENDLRTKQQRERELQYRRARNGQDWD